MQYRGIILIVPTLYYEKKFSDGTSLRVPSGVMKPSAKSKIGTEVIVNTPYVWESINISEFSLEFRGRKTFSLSNPVAYGAFGSRWMKSQLNLSDIQKKLLSPVQASV